MPGKGHILIVDDDDLLRESVRARLEQDGYRVTVAANGATAITAALRNPPDLVLLDIGLPDSDGLDICRALQRERALPIIFLTGRNSEIDKVSGLALGDDYVTKPFSLIELEARIGMVLRRTRQAAQSPRGDVIEISGVRLDTLSHQVTVQGAPVDLSPKEFDLLHLLMSRAGEALTANEILSQVWGPEYTGAHELVYVHVSWLRQKLRVNPDDAKLIHTVRGVGYRFLSAEE